MKRLIMCLAAALAACAVLGAAAAETAQPVTAAELDGLLESVRTQALAGEPLNDPADAEAQSEDGTLFRYEVARIYGEGTALDAGTPVAVIQQQLGMHPYAAKQTARQCARLSAEWLTALYEKCVDFDYAVKSGRLRDRDALDVLIIEIGLAGKSKR